MSDLLKKQTVQERLIIAKSLLETVIDELPYTESKKNTIAEWKRDFKEYITFLGLLRDDYNGIVEYIDEVPITEPERKKGKWIHEIHDNPNTFRCSKCNKYLDIGCGNMKMNFCLNCGADMRGEQNG